MAKNVIKKDVKKDVDHKLTVTMGEMFPEVFAKFVKKRKPVPKK